MSQISETLFDLQPYGGELGSRSRDREPSSARVDPPVEALAPGWRYVRNRGGVLPYAHLVKTQLGTGAVLTLCDAVGTVLSNDGIDQMRRCPACDIGVQLI